MLGSVLDALLTCLAFLDRSDDDVVDSHFAVRVLEEVVVIFEGLDPADRASLAGLVRARAAQENDPALKEFLEEFPAAFGLVNGDD